MIGPRIRRRSTTRSPRQPRQITSRACSTTSGRGQVEHQPEGLADRRWQRARQQPPGPSARPPARRWSEKRRSSGTGRRPGSRTGLPGRDRHHAERLVAPRPRRRAVAFSITWAVAQRKKSAPTQRTGEGRRSTPGPAPVGRNCRWFATLPGSPGGSCRS